jgi:DHA2 family multidrug resistance protein
VAWLIGWGFTVLGCSMWYYASFNLDANYGKEAWARAVQGFGIAFLFVPISQLAYSYLPKNKNNKASSLTNLCRNWGGSFGIAFVTTLVERRTQYHRSILAAHITASNANASATLANLKNGLIQHGYSSADASLRALARLDGMMQKHASIYGFLDCFWLLGVIAMAGPVLAIFIKKFNQRGGGAGAH